MIAFSLDTVPVRAQQGGGDQGGRLLEEVVVTAKPISQRKIVGTDVTGRTTESVTLQRHVSFEDLDLSRPADVDKLRKRIEVNAEEVCKELDEVYPLLRWDSNDTRQDCIRRAVDSAKEGLEEAISAAR